MIVLRDKKYKRQPVKESMTLYNTDHHVKKKTKKESINIFKITFIFSPEIIPIRVREKLYICSRLGLYNYIGDR